MEALDWLVIGVFFLALIGIIVWVVRQKQNDSADYFLGGRDATWLAIGASIFASNIGSEHLIGLAGAGASSGMAMAHWEIQGWMILILGWVFVPFYTRSMVYTMPEFLERRYNPQSRTILSVISLVSYVLTKVAVTVYAGGLVFQQVFGIKELWGIDFFWIAAIGLVVLTALYTIFGGMKSVLYTSVLQTPILLLGSLIILVLGFKELGGWDEMMRQTTHHHCCCNAAPLKAQLSYRSAKVMCIVFLSSCYFYVVRELFQEDSKKCFQLSACSIIVCLGSIIFSFFYFDLFLDTCQ